MHKSYEIYNRESIQLVVRDEDEQGMGRNVLEVNIYFHSKFGQEPRGEVNWAAHGSVKPEVAYTYSRMLARAAEIAHQLDSGCQFEAMQRAQDEGSIVTETEEF